MINQQEKEFLERELTKLQALPPDQVQLLTLEKHHGLRRQWLWFELGMAPLAGVLEHLSGLAELTDRVFSGTQPAEMAALYRERYWRADDLVLKTLASPLPITHQALVQKLLGVIYTPWLVDGVTRNFQELVKANGYPGAKLRLLQRPGGTAAWQAPPTQWWERTSVRECRSHRGLGHHSIF